MSTPVPLAALVVLAAAAAPAAAAERSFTVTGFDRIRVDGPYSVRLTTGVAPFARATGPTGALDRVAIDVQGQTLVVRPSRSSWGGNSGGDNGPVEIALGTHELERVWINGPGSLSIDRVEGLSFEAALQGSGSLGIVDAEVDQLEIGISGAGSARVAGTAPKLTAIVRGSSVLDASALSVKDAVLGAEGPSVLKAQVSNSAKVDAIGAAQVEIAGAPACTVKAQGSATVVGCAPSR